MNVLDWYEEYCDRRRNAPDCPHVVEQMFTVFARGFHHGNARESVQYYEQSLQLAGEDEFGLWIRHFLAQSLEDIGRAAEANTLLVKNAILARDPKYAHMPVGIMSNNVLASRMASRDPHGYQNEVIASYEYLDRICEPKSDHSCIYLSTMSEMYLDLGDLKLAREYMDRRFVAAEACSGASSFYICWQYARMAFIEHLDANYELQLRFADLGLSNAPEDLQCDRALHAIRASALARLGDQSGAERAYRAAVKPMGETLTDRTYEALSDYWLASGRKDKAIDVLLEQQRDRDRELYTWEVACGALELIKLYSELGDSAGAESWRNTLRDICELLKKPLHPKFNNALAA